MMGAKLCSSVYPQMMQNNAGKPFSTGIYNRKTLKKVIAILKQFSYCFINHECKDPNLRTHRQKITFKL